YDAYDGADAAGNVVTGFACADCAGYIDATNNQANSGNVSATAQTTINGTNRAVITGTNAVGNAATFYVSRSGN
ncbi:MAG TPA: holdfast attachment protein D, partial [Brevundimonas sp.]|nr:holdfast attachment protein D [Brevundimonas sp.]